MSDSIEEIDNDVSDYVDLFDLNVLEPLRNTDNIQATVMPQVENVTVREIDPVPSTSRSEGHWHASNIPIDVPIIPQLDHLLTANVSRQRLIGLRMVELEERMGIFQFAIWKMPVEGAAETVRRLISDITGIEYSLNEFIIVSALDANRQGVLVRVSTASLKQLIFNCKMLLIFRGYNIDYLFSQ
ncbi:uncharacterized protein LOC122506322 [Leptopilina heterotoma]|uniref:uncharacterized protein LOC122499996 n=1 Tax=Leptopilina heterotoma TaxID=63436 RepID=UPI001CA858CB|nr:uncharacterized protein LOC122499996 [Leptopilina heterotoma]XP_043467496.1 uncharacterized protein LOC122501811 [Leptopilina heterotoma]XP_043471979.1 uncharacterized protein LOC122504795 [Leptopilina heterotoma]XP_043474372.1 uncharacterized protein LOC122506322 [Leptopilina heterotoma]